MAKGLPRAQAVAIQDDRIVAVGSDAQILPLCRPRTREIDLDGQTLMPGFIDAHTHLLNDADYWGMDLDEAQQMALQDGITTLANMYVTPGFLAEMQEMADSGRLRVRTSLYLNYTTNCGDVLGDWCKQHPPTREPGEMLRIGGAKLFTDGGSCGSPAPTYEHPFHSHGDLWFTQDELNAAIANIHAAGYQASSPT
jgi:predicted amidohydrolase YtcJ